MRWLSVLVMLTFLGIPGGVQAQQKKPLTNADVIQMVKSGFSEQTIVGAINANDTAFDTSAQGLLQLKNAGVNQSIIDVMLSAEARQRALSQASPGGAGTPGTAQQEFNQNLKNQLYGAIENHDFTWVGKEVQLGFYSAHVNIVCQGCNANDSLVFNIHTRYLNWIDAHAYTFSDNGDKEPGNRLHPGAHLEGKQVNFSVPPSYASRYAHITFTFEARGTWDMGRPHPTALDIDLYVKRDSLSSLNSQAVFQELKPYLVPVGNVATNEGAAGESAPSASGSASNPLLQQAADLDKQADEAAAKAQELAQKSQRSRTGLFGGMAAMTYSVEAKRWRKKESQFREQAQQLRARASQTPQIPNGQDVASPASASVAPQPGSAAQPALGAIGCTVTKVTSQMAQEWKIAQEGLYAQRIQPGSFCDRMTSTVYEGRGRGPIIILLVNGQWVNSSEEFYKHNSELRPGQTVTWTYVNLSEPDRFRHRTVGSWPGSK